MSVQFSSSVSGVVQRRAEVDDVSTFNTLLNASGGPALFRATFGQYNYPAMIEGSISSLISVAEEEGKCLGFLVVNDSPTVSTENDTFLATVSSVATLLPDVKATNTLFLNFFLVDETSRYDSDKVSFDLVRNAFVASPQADYIIWLCPSKVRLGFWMEDNFVHVPLPKSEDESGNGTALGAIPFGVKLLYMHRNAFIPKLLVRTARVEDNDDLLPILRSSNPQVVSGQSDFFLADLIQSQDERNKFLVGVYKDSPVGMLATSLDVNVSLLTRIFDIDGYSDIIVAKEKKLHPPPLFISVMGEIRAVEKNTMRDVITDMNCLFVDAEEVLSRQSSSEEKSGESINEEEETKFARLAMDELKNFLVGLLAQAEGKNEHPTAIVVSGFPRNDTEAHEMSRGYLNFDVLLEFSDYAKQKAGDREDDDGDVYLKKHLDAVEALHSFTDAQPPTATPWYLVTLGADGGPNDKDFQTCVSNIVDQRAREVDRILALDEEEPPKANAFAVTVFCMDVDFETRGVDLLRVAFEDNPKLDYCLYMVSNSAPPTKLTASMVMVKQRVGVTFDQTLYIVQRDALIAADLLQVVRLDVSQMSAVEKFTTPLHSFGNARAQLLNSCVESLKQNDIDLKDNPPEVSFAIMMGADMVGILTASRNYLGSEDIVWMRCNYHLDEVINFDRHRLRAQAQITNFVINPVYSKWTRYIIREVMRKCMKTVLYYHNPVDDVPPSEILEELIAVPPRRRMQPNLGTSLPMIEKPSSNCVNVESPLMYITKRQITELKVCVTKKVVVIGGGSASYALLEKLLYTSHLYFPNIQLVMELPPKAFKITQAADPSFDYSEKCSGDLTFEDADDPSMQELTAMGIGHRISVVRGRLTDIDRANKAIVISDEVVSEYDLLVVASSTKDCSTKKFPTTSGTHPLHCAYRGMFGLGDAVSDARALEWVLRQSADRPHVVVCGSDMETIGVAGALLSRGVDPNRITVVISLPKIADVVHPFVVESALRSLRGSGVFIKMGFEIVDVNLTKFGSVESVQLRCLTSDPTIESNESGGADSMMYVIPCYSLLCCGTKYCDADVFAAINESGIVYDGGVVVDKVRCTTAHSLPPRNPQILIHLLAFLSTINSELRNERP